MSDDVIKEFLVGLGFKVDEGKLKKFTGGIGLATKAAFGLATTAAAMATAVVGAVVKMSDRFEQLYYLSQRVGSSAANISAYAYAFEQVGGTADAAKGSIEAISNFMKFNPGGERFIQGLGVRTREANGELRDTTDVLIDVSKALKGMPLAKANVVAGALGIDSQTLQILMRDNGAFFEDYKKKLQAAGVDQDQAAAASARLMQQWRELKASLIILADGLLIKLQPAIESLLRWINEIYARFMEWKNSSSSFLNSAQWSQETQQAVGEIMQLFKAVGGLLDALWKLLKVLWDYVGPALIELAHGQLKLLITALNFVAGVIRTIVALLTGDWGTAWREAKKTATDTLSGLVDVAMSLVSAVKKVWYSITHKGADMPEDRSGAPAAGGAAAGGGHANDNAPAIAPNSAAGRAIAFFMGKGWSREQATGIAANLKQESEFNHRAVGDGGKAFGLAQWHPDRQAAFKRWAGKDIRNSSFDEQLAFIHYEMTQGAEQAAGARLRKATSAYGAAGVVSQFYERPQDTHAEIARRGQIANQLLSSAPLTGRGSQVTMNQKTEINVRGGDARTTADAVVAAQDRVNSNVVRNMKSAVS